MSRSFRAYQLLEALFGRQVLWRVGRFLYAGARRELSNDPAVDGEYALQSWVADYMHGLEAPVVWDVGANLGYWSTALMETLSSKGVQARIFAFEPAPSQRAILSDVAVPNPLRLDVFDVALAAAPGHAQFEVTGERSGSSAIMAGEEKLKSKSTVISVELSTVDVMMETLGCAKIHFLKIDTEGNDFNVLLGATKAFQSQSIDIVQFEYAVHWLNFGRTLHDAMDLAAQHNYLFGRLTPKEIELYSEWHPELERFVLANFVMIAQAAADALPTRMMTFDRSNVAVPQ